MRVCEIYHSVQGEGLLAGTPSVFIRSSGCNLRCWFCDTPFASWEPEGNNLSVAEILEKISPYDAQHIVITGGEPMLWPELADLCGQLKNQHRHITIETAGTVFLDLPCDLMSISPKLATSAPQPNTPNGWHQRHEATRHQPQIVQQLMRLAPYQLKFVVDSPADAAEVLEYLHLLTNVDRDRVMLMPQGMTVDAVDQQAEWLIPWCQHHEVRYCDRAHLRWFGNQRGT